MKNNETVIKLFSDNSSTFLCHPLLLFQHFEMICEVSETIAAKECIKAIIFKGDSADIRHSKLNNVFQGFLFQSTHSIIYQLSPDFLYELSAATF